VFGFQFKTTTYFDEITVYYKIVTNESKGNGECGTRLRIPALQVEKEMSV
jgi:hypothetical protein